MAGSNEVNLNESRVISSVQLRFYMLFSFCVDLDSGFLFL